MMLFNDVIQGTAEKMVGQKKSAGQQKNATAWWKGETRQATKLKKQLQWSPSYKATSSAGLKMAL